MRIEDLMSKDPVTCHPQQSLADAAGRMWERDCGFLPVVGMTGRLMGVLTDRDVCMGALTRGRPLDELDVGRSMVRDARTCRIDEDVASAAATMAKHQVRRLPVVDRSGAVVGVISVNDLVRGMAKTKSGAGVPPEEVLDVLRGVCAPHVAAPQAAVQLTPAPAKERAVAIEKPAPAKPAAVEARPGEVASSKRSSGSASSGKAGGKRGKGAKSSGRKKPGR